MNDSKPVGTSCAQGRSERRTRVLVVLPRGETLRNFVYNDFLSTLRQTCEVHVATVRPDQRLFDLVRTSADSASELVEPKPPWLVRILTQFLDMAHGRYLWSVPAQMRWARLYATPGTWARTKMRTKLMLARLFGGARGVRWLAAFHEWLCIRLVIPAPCLELVRDWSPHLVFNASHSHSANAWGVMFAARKLGVPTATFLFSWDNLTSQGRVVPEYDYYAAWTTDIASDLKRIYPRSRRAQIEVTGTPQFEFHFRAENRWSRERFCDGIQADPARPLVLYTTGMSHHFPHERMTIRGIARALLKMNDLGSPQLLVRLYGKEMFPERFDGLEQEADNIVMCPVRWVRDYRTPEPEDAPYLTNAMLHCAVGINIASTVSLELCLLDRPVINVAYDPPENTEKSVDYETYYNFDHYRPIVESGGVELARSEEELARLIRANLERPERRAEERRNLVNEFFGGYPDGSNARRIASTVAEFARHARARRDR